MASGGWEQVGKAKKPKGGAASGKGEKKSFIDSMPRIEPKAPVKESETIYDALKVKDSLGKHAANGDSATKPSAIPKLKKQTSGDGAVKPTSKPSGASSSSSVAAEKKQPTVEDVTKQLTRIEFETLLSKTTAIFPESPHLWLKDVAGHLNAKFESVEESPDPVFEKSPSDYPMSLLPKAVVSFFVNVMSKCPADVLQLFLDHCIQTAMAELSKGVPIYGYRMVVQILATKHASLFTSNLQKHLDTILASKSHVLRCLTALWCLGQGGLHSLAVGMRVWLDVMLPLLGVKALAPYAISYVERLLDIHSKDAVVGSAAAAGDGRGGAISPAQFFVIFDGVFGLGGSSPAALTQPLHKRLQAVYPRLKAMAFAGGAAAQAGGSSLHKLFPSFVVRLPACKQAAQRDEVISCIVTCLQKDRESFATWMLMYRRSVAEHAQATSIIIKHVVSHWDQLSRIGGARPDLLRDAVLSFVAVNEELGRSVTGEAARQHVTDCDSACKALIGKSERAEAAAAAQSYAKLFVTVLLVLSGLVGFDLYQHGGFPGSKCEYLLRESHVMCAFTSLVEASSSLGRRVAEVTQSRLPPLIRQTQDVAEKLLTNSYTLVEELSRPLRIWVQDNVPVYLDWVVTHPVWSATCSLLVKGWSWLTGTLGTAWITVKSSIQ